MKDMVELLAFLKNRVQGWESMFTKEAGSSPHQRGVAEGMRHMIKGIECRVSLPMDYTRFSDEGGVRYGPFGPIVYYLPGGNPEGDDVDTFYTSSGDWGP